MWILHLLPDSFLELVVNLVFLVGIIGTAISFTIISWIPGLRNYKTLAQILSVVILSAGLYWKGGYGVEAEWRDRVAQLEAKLKTAQEKSQQVNTVIETKVVTKVKHIKDTQVKIQKEIVEKEKIINAECTVPPEAIELLNKAAEKPVAGEAK